MIRSCTICKKPMILIPSAAERAKKFGGTAADYTALFRDHAACIVAKRSAEARELAEREVRLSKIDIDNPRPQFWTRDLARYQQAKVALTELK